MQEEELNQQRMQIEQQLAKVAISTSEPDQLKEELAKERIRANIAEEKLAKLEKTELELEKLKKDQEDLLELLTDQDSKLNEFKVRLKALGERVRMKINFFKRKFYLELSPLGARRVKTLFSPLSFVRQWRLQLYKKVSY